MVRNAEFLEGLLIQTQLKAVMNMVLMCYITWIVDGLTWFVEMAE